MNSLTLELHKARDAEDSFALAVKGDPNAKWRAVTGFGSDFAPEWTVELQSSNIPELALIAWNAVLERIVEAAELNDPVITDYQWPVTSNT